MARMTWGAIGVLLSGLVATAQVTEAGGKEAPRFERVTGPFSARNLEVFLIHTPDESPRSDYVVASQAWAARTLTARESHTVGRVRLENRSRSTSVYVPGGTILSGGEQDRVIPDDLVLAPASGPVDVAAFCIESGRWCGRAGTSAGLFVVNELLLPGRALKIAARGARDQGRVWTEVAEFQKLLSAAVGVPTHDQASPTSLFLTLQHVRVRSQATPYQQGLDALAQRHPRAVGCAYVINGKLAGFEVFRDPALFRTAWPSVLAACALEALCENGDPVQERQMQRQDIAELLATAESGSTAKPAPGTGPEAGRTAGGPAPQASPQAQPRRIARTLVMLGDGVKVLQPAPPDGDPRFLEPRGGLLLIVTPDGGDARDGGPPFRRSYLLP